MSTFFIVETIDNFVKEFLNIDEELLVLLKKIIFGIKGYNGNTMA